MVLIEGGKHACWRIKIVFTLQESTQVHYIYKYLFRTYVECTPSNYVNTPASLQSTLISTTLPCSGSDPRILEGDERRAAAATRDKCAHLCELLAVELSHKRIARASRGDCNTPLRPYISSHALRSRGQPARLWGVAAAAAAVPSSAPPWVLCTCGSP